MTDEPGIQDAPLDFVRRTSAAGRDEGGLDPAVAPDDTDTDREPVGRVQGQDPGYAGETGAEARADGDIGGAAGGRQ